MSFTNLRRRLCQPRLAVRGISGSFSARRHQSRSKCLEHGFDESSGAGNNHPSPIDSRFRRDCSRTRTASAESGGAKQLENLFRITRIFLEQSPLPVRVLLLSASKVLLYCSAGESTHCLFSKAPAREILGPTADSRNNRPLITDLARDRNGSLLVCGWCAA